MNTFFYNLGKSTYRAQHSATQAVANSYVASTDAAKSFVAGYADARAEVNPAPQAAPQAA